MKFGKKFSSQMVHGWQHDYMDYDSLKKHLKLRPARGGAKKPKRIMHRCLIRQRLGKSHDVEEGVPLTAETTTNGPIQVVIKTDGQVKTKFLMEESEGGEYESGFFGLLDKEFNKVNKFYKKKVEEVLKQKEVINKKMEALIGAGFGSNDKEIKRSYWILTNFMTKMGLHSKVKNSEESVWEEPEEREEDVTTLAFGIATCSAANSPTPAGGKSMKVPSQALMEIVGEGESSRTGQLEDGAIEPVDEVNASRPAASYTIDGFESNNTKSNLSKSEQTLRKAYIELYRELGVLKKYSSSNVKAFSKILEKYDRITSRGARKVYMKVVDDYLGSSDEVAGLVQYVEETFIEHFAESNRSKGMKMLRPKATRERHRLTFSTGFSAGCVFSLIVALAAIIRTRNSLQGEGQEIYMNTMFPLYSWFGFVMLHIIMYAANLYYWRRYKINYSKIFNFEQGTELGDRQVLLVAFSIGVFALLCVLANLDMEVDPVTKHEAFTELLPLFLLIGIFGVLFLPINFFYYSNRKFYLTCLFHCIAAPFYKVSFADSFLGDQFTSQVQALRSFEFYICYYGWGDFKHRQNTCTRSHVYNGFFFIVAVIPFVSRLLQCLRRLVDDKKNDHRWNGVKYFLTIVAVCFRTACSIQQDQIAWRVLAIIFSVVAAIFGTYWDFVHDWGLLKPSSENRWLRDKLLIPQKEVYFIAMILNVLLRFAWIQTVLDFNLSFRHSTQTMVAVVASLEIIRRGIWNFFRLENEHLKINGGDKDP
ncbi:hypothetical protein N665_1835s0003 [Sinapis alba]|nr:hypothetical protein N665_1835s0003 [Sinapis alba]